MTSFIVLGSLSSIDPKEKCTKECIEACQTLEDKLSWLAYLSHGIKVCLYRKQQMCVFIKVLSYTIPAEIADDCLFKKYD